MLAIFHDFECIGEINASELTILHKQLDVEHKAGRTLTMSPTGSYSFWPISNSIICRSHPFYPSLDGPSRISLADQFDAVVLDASIHNRNPANWLQAVKGWREE